MIPTTSREGKQIMNDLPAFNEPLATKVLDHITAHPEEWNQKDWRCRTGMCYAGTTVDLLGYQWTSQGGNSVWTQGDRLVTEHCSTVAVRELGLTNTEAGHLFLSGNTLSDLTEMIDLLRAGIRGEEFARRADEILERKYENIEPL